VSVDEFYDFPQAVAFFVMPVGCRCLHKPITHIVENRQIAEAMDAGPACLLTSNSVLYAPCRYCEVLSDLVEQTSAPREDGVVAPLDTNT
jgi:hypothetical protein